MWAVIIGFFWGLMEGLWFFIVPDVALSFLAIKSGKSAFKATAGVVLGALLSSGGLYYWSHHSTTAGEKMLQVWSYFPGYYPKMLDVARGHLELSGASGLLSGPNSGIPYRFYIHEALGLNLSLLDVWLWTPFARLERILIAPVVVLSFRWVLNKAFTRWWPKQKKRLTKLLIVFVSLYWVVIYILYWGVLLPGEYGA